MADDTVHSDTRDRYATSRELQRKAEADIPEATSSNVRGKSSYAPYSMVFMEEGDGPVLRDVDGNEYLDFLCGVSAIINGHSPDRQVAATKAQVERGSYFATAHPEEQEAARLFNQLVPSAERTKFISTGTEAVMSAVRLARAFTGKEKVLKFEGMYHGHTDYMLLNVHPDPSSLGTRQNAETIPAAAGVPPGTRDSVITLPWNDRSLLEETIEREADELAAVITEGFLSNSGLIHPKEGYIDALREVTRENDVLLILDEVVTGFRASLQGAEGYHGIRPDLSVWGKALANGYPCAAVSGRADIMDFIGGGSDRGDFMGTFSGNPLVMAATHANLKILEDVGEDGYETFAGRGQRLVTGLEETISDAGHTVWVPDFVGFTHVYFHDGETNPEDWSDWRDVARHESFGKWSQFAKAMIDEGIYMVPRDHGRINISHAHTDEHIDEALEAAKVAAERISD